MRLSATYKISTQDKTHANRPRNEEFETNSHAPGGGPSARNVDGADKAEEGGGADATEGGDDEWDEVGMQ